MVMPTAAPLTGCLFPPRLGSPHFCLGTNPCPAWPPRIPRHFPPETFCACVEGRGDAGRWQGLSILDLSFLEKEARQVRRISEMPWLATIPGRLTWANGSEAEARQARHDGRGGKFQSESWGCPRHDLADAMAIQRWCHPRPLPRCRLPACLPAATSHNHLGISPRIPQHYYLEGTRCRSSK